MEMVLASSRAEPTAEEKGAAFEAYLEEIGLPAAQVLGDLGPAEVGDVVSFFYAGMPDRFKDRDRGEAGEDAPTGREGVGMPAEHWCAAVWEDDSFRAIA